MRIYQINLDTKILEADDPIKILRDGQLLHSAEESNLENGDLVIVSHRETIKLQLEKTAKLTLTDLDNLAAAGQTYFYTHAINPPTPLDDLAYRPYTEHQNETTLIQFANFNAHATQLIDLDNVLAAVYGYHFAVDFRSITTR